MTQVTIKIADIKAGQTFGDAYGENEYTVVKVEFCKWQRKTLVWCTDLDGNYTGMTVETINDIIKFQSWDNISGFYNK